MLRSVVPPVPVGDALLGNIVEMIVSFEKLVFDGPMDMFAEVFLETKVSTKSMGEDAICPVYSTANPTIKPLGADVDTVTVFAPTPLLFAQYRKAPTLSRGEVSRCQVFPSVSEIVSVPCPAVKVPDTSKNDPSVVLEG